MCLIGAFGVGVALGALQPKYRSAHARRAFTDLRITIHHKPAMLAPLCTAIDRQHMTALQRMLSLYKRARLIYSVVVARNCCLSHSRRFKFQLM